MLTTLTTLLGAYAITAPFFGAVSDCGSGKSAFTINSLSLEPATPNSGQNVTLNLDYSVPDGVVVTGGTAEYDITWNFIPFEPTTEPLCQDIQCPLGAGRYTNQSTTQWPSGVNGYISSQMKWFDTANTLLLCVEIQGQAGDRREVALTMSGPAAPQPSRRPLQIREPVQRLTLDQMAAELLRRSSERLQTHFQRLRALL